MSGQASPTSGVNEFVRAAPHAQRIALRVLLAVGSRPRGVRLLKWLSPLDQLVGGLLTFDRYDDPGLSRDLGWDAELVVARGRELRRREGRP